MCCCVRRLSGADDDHMVVEQLKMLEGRNLIKQMEPGKWVRKVLDETTGQVTQTVRGHRNNWVRSQRSIMH